MRGSGLLSNSTRAQPLKHRYLAALCLMGQLALGQTAIQHIVIIMQENRTTDNLFHDPVLIQRGADIASGGYNSKGRFIKLMPVHLNNHYDLRHMHADFESEYDRGKMDGADLISIDCKSLGHCPPNPQFKYVYGKDVAPYFQMAETYVFADHMFQTNQGPSFSSHLFIISGTSAPTETSNLFAAEVPIGGNGCAAQKRASVYMINREGQENFTMYPCFEHETLPDELDAAGTSWRYYAFNCCSMWNAPNAIKHLRFGPDWKKNVILNPDQIMVDVGQGQLAQVSWVTPDYPRSDHPGENDGTGPAWVASIVNTIGQSQYWNSTVIFITWDDWGGWYDHVAPKIYDSYEYGLRVPLLVISPYAKAGYISHVTHDFGSILKFTEGVFGLPSLGFADSRADDLSDCFNFNQKPLVFRPIAAPHDASYFVRHPPRRSGNGILRDDD